MGVVSSQELVVREKINTSIYSLTPVHYPITTKHGAIT